jgi:type I restriction enzyme S subunit
MYLNQITGETEKYQTRTTGIRNLHINDYFATSIPLPPLDEQRRIAGIIEKKRASVTKLKTHLAEQAEAINALPAASLRKAFRGEL